MKRVLILLMLLAFLSSVSTVGVSAMPLTGEAIMMPFGIEFAPYAIYGFNVTLTTVNGPPSLKIYLPQNGTYLSETVPLKFGISGATKVVVKVDNSTVSSLSFGEFMDGGLTTTSFHSPSGIHMLSLEAINENSLNFSTTWTIRTFQFNVSTSNPRIDYSRFEGSDNGNSTNLLFYTYEQLQNPISLVLENSRYGKIVFSDPIYLLNDSNPNDGIIDITSNSEITLREIYINSLNLPNLNRTATLFFYDINFTDPQMMRDDSLCNSSICTRVSYENGTFEFNVTGFSRYKVVENPIYSPPPVYPDDYNESGRGGAPVVKNAAWVNISKNENVSLPAPPMKNCSEKWDCSEWSECVGERQERKCSDLNSCGTQKAKPREKKLCFPPLVNPFGSMETILLFLFILIIVLLLIGSRKKNSKRKK